ncbi:MAG: AbrB family transcriptional regulator [Clostridia bacterium]|jgi:bifunctional DNA-binding transcriptional regulator/antitoxin component of YhaV-PrlF toxin-antitoxin module|nr:AbrB family transcriptional regulator [Clostridia bacterium]
MKAKPIYKIIDEKGRILIPKALRTSSGMDYGDIVKLSIHQGTVSLRKVDLIEIGDQSPEAVEAYVHAAIRNMPEEKQIGIAVRLLELIEQRKGQRHE